MALIAIRAQDGREVEAFSVDGSEWDAMKRHPKGSYLMVGTGWPAVLKRSIRGLQFFAHAPGYPGVKPKPESEPHMLAKIGIARALRAAGHTAWVEKTGSSPAGEQWQADVLCQVGERMIAFEVQLAHQTLEGYEARSRRYTDSGVQCVWLVRAPTHFQTLSKATYYRIHKPGTVPTARPMLPNLAALPLDIGDPKHPRIDDMRVVVFPEGKGERLTLTAFCQGVAEGRLVFEASEWRWRSQVAKGFIFAIPLWEAAFLNWVSAFRD